MTSFAETRAAFAQQAQACDALGSPFMVRLMQMLQARLAPGTVVADRVLNWPGPVGPEAASVPLRLAGALHALVLSGNAPDLAAQYPPHAPTDDALWGAVQTALETHSAFLNRWLDTAPQTNEVRRAAALVPVLHLLAAATEHPIDLIELGCSGGLNLRCDQFRVQAGQTSYGPADSAVQLTPEWSGPCPPAATLSIASRTGVDLNPLDPAQPEDALRLRAYLWPDQPDRMARTQAAIALAQRCSARLKRADAIAALPGLLEPTPGRTRVVFHTVAWQYFPPEAQARGAQTLAQAGTAATSDSPLARISMEWDSGRGAALGLTLWPSGKTTPLGRVDFHGQWLEWTGPTAL